jgi:hypothetical protein
MQKTNKYPERAPRPGHEEIVHALIKHDSADPSSFRLLNTVGQPDGSTPEQAEELGIALFESTLDRLELGYRENGFLDNAGLYRLVKATVTIPTEPSCSMWKPDSFEASPEWQAHRADIQARLADPALWQDAQVIRERSVGEAGSVPMP